MMGTIVQLLSSELRLSNPPEPALTLVRGASPDTSPVGLFCEWKQQFKMATHTPRPPLRNTRIQFYC